MKEEGSTSGEKFIAPISHSYLCDYMLIGECPCVATANQLGEATIGEMEVRGYLTGSNVM
jgi:hypothetical protein